MLAAAPATAATAATPSAPTTATSAAAGGSTSGSCAGGSSRNCVRQSGLNVGELVSDGGCKVLCAGYRGGGHEGGQQRIFDEVLPGLIEIEAGTSEGERSQCIGAWDWVEHTGPP